MSKQRVSTGQIAETKVDLKKRLGPLYRPSPNEVTIIDVPALLFLMIDGAGDPNSAQEYEEALRALYSLAYTLKLLLKQEHGLDYSVMPLEGLWWTPDMRAFDAKHKERWLWTMMIAQPPGVTAALVERAREQAQRKKPDPCPGPAAPGGVPRRRGRADPVSRPVRGGGADHCPVARVHTSSTAMPCPGRIKSVGCWRARCACPSSTQSRGVVGQKSLSWSAPRSRLGADLPTTGRDFYS